LTSRFLLILETSFRFRSIWISDVHLGTRSAQAEHLLHFLRATESEHLYLVGDIIDGWRLSRSWYWIQTHNDVVQKLLRKARKGTKVTYIPGNHDEFARDYAGFRFGGIDVRRNAEHVTAGGRRFLVLHGDEFDVSIRYARWLAVLGASAYEASVQLNRVVNGIRRRLGYGYWSLAGYLKNKVKKAIRFIDDYEASMILAATRAGADGVICGHIHRPELRRQDGILYCNTGDWVENCTALVEHFDGRLELISWVSGKTRHRSNGSPAAEPLSAEVESEHA
jgi:UDP-2,3-diacylglucosamine pyrophosphatase LpxH